MKKLLLPLLILLTISLSAQIPIKLEINHKLGTSPFHMNQMAQNSLMQDFEVTNLRYYLSGFSMTHDGGQVTEMPDLLVFVDVSLDSLGNQLIELGNFAVSQIEAISFYMGVDTARNHLDPTVYAENHPLAPKNPSMHWGWASGYFFLSFNGSAGVNMSKGFDLQCLGDENYFQTTVSTPLVTDYSDELLISLDADYTGLLHEMDISENISMHGPFLWAHDALVNASRHVFKSSMTPNYTAISKEIHQDIISLYPNPALNGETKLSLKEGLGNNYQVVVCDVTGKEMMRKTLDTGKKEITIELNQKGFYLVNVFDEHSLVATKKLIVR